MLVGLGVFLAIIVFLIRPAGAEAVLPSGATIFTEKEASNSAIVEFSNFESATYNYDVLLEGKKTPTKIAMTGVPIADLFRGLAPKVDITKVPYVKVRFGDSDGAMMLVALSGGPDSTPPPMILESGRRPGIGPFPTPAILPGQPTSAPISEKQILPFDRKKDKLNIIPMEGQILSGIRLKRKKTAKGQYKYTVSGAPSGTVFYKWYEYDNDSAPTEISAGKTWTTTNARDNTRTHVIRVVVSTADGSTGTDSDGYVGRKANDGATRDPGFTDPSDGDANTVPGNPGGFPGGTPQVTPTPTPNTIPQLPPVLTPPQQVTPPTSSPTPPTSTFNAPATPTTTAIADQSGLVIAAKDVTTNAPLTSVSGVLLTEPAEGAANGGGGEPGTDLGLTKLQEQAIVDPLQSVFQPVEDPGDLWPYLLTLLFASGLSGAVREWVNP